ncbi:hypothetical protein CHU98_g1518 [Xylaria longipes]|nr:hypothetical protein CHU98_g1518 [Xylaria longipes]
MAPKRITVQPGSRAAAPKGVIASTYSALTSPENASVVKSVAVFGPLERVPAAPGINGETAEAEAIRATAVETPARYCMYGKLNAPTSDVESMSEGAQAIRCRAALRAKSPQEDPAAVDDNDGGVEGVSGSLRNRAQEARHGFDLIEYKVELIL